MHVIICVDKNNGMMFNGRRQSQDSVLREKVIELCKESKLWMNEYSGEQFSEFSEIHISNDFLKEASEGEFCFVEDGKLPAEGIEKVYVFNWNRKYPGDVFFEFDLKANGFKRGKKLEFVGSSHDKITLEIYESEG